MGLLDRLFSSARERDAWRPAYLALVAQAREPRWYLDAGVPDTRTGRFAVLTTLLALVLLRLERDGGDGRDLALVTELFVEDMEGHLRQDGIADQSIGKHVRALMGGLAGRHAALSAAGADHDALGEVARRNFYGGEPPSEAAADVATALLAGYRAALAATGSAELRAGRLPRL